MSQRDSGYERKERDSYETPAWVTGALLPHLPKGIRVIWEPACGSGKMVRALTAGGYDVVGTDIEDGTNFLDCMEDTAPQIDAIVTNPPYIHAQAFIEKALFLGDFVAMLLRTDFDHAKTRQHLFSGSSIFAKKLVLTKRIIWFDGPSAAPSFNHAWYIWNRKHQGAPILAYGPALTAPERARADHADLVKS